MRKIENRISIYLAEEECEEKLLKALKLNPGLMNSQKARI